jgi:hypothetical protein
MATFKFRRGEYVRDIVTNFTGVITGRADYLTSCNGYIVQPEIDKDGKPQDGHWFDEMRLEYDPERIGQRVRLERFVDQPPG